MTMVDASGAHPQLETAHQYAAGRLDSASAEAFEEHLLECEQCQTEVRLAVGVRRVAAEAPARSSSRPARRWMAGASLLIAAGIVGVLVMQRRIDPRLAALGRVTDPPSYIGMSVRSRPQRGDSLFDAAMTAYSAGRYERAASGLRDARAAGVDSIPAQFFMASAQLMSGHPAEAEALYARVIGAGARAAPYLAESHLYRARALLQLGRAADAQRELAAVGSVDALVAARARALSDSVQQVMQR